MRATSDRYARAATAKSISGRYTSSSAGSAANAGSQEADGAAHYKLARPLLTLAYNLI